MQYGYNNNLQQNLLGGNQMNSSQFQQQHTYRNPNVQQADPLHDDVQGEIRQRTHLIQLYTNDPDEGPRLISDFHPKGIPIMVIVDPPCCCYWKLNVPHGIVTMEQIWGKHTGVMDPGYHCCYPSYKRIAAMITKNSIQFNTPIEACPTKDNVRVSVDIGITFHIGKEATRNEDCEKFLYYLGANKLEELLQQECEESIRNFIRTIKVNKIRDIKSELTTQMMEELNQRFNQYGVYMEQVNVMNVIIPRDLRVALQQATTYDVLLQNQVKYQENVIIKLMNENDKTLQTLKRENQKKILDLNHQLAMEEILLEENRVKIESDQKIALVSAEEKQSIKVIQAEAIKSQAQQKSKKAAESIMAEASAYSQSKTIDTDANKQSMNLKAQVRYDVSKLKSAGQIQEADAEAAQAQNLQNKRKFEQKMKMVENMKTMVEQNKIVISGENGDELLSFFKDTTELVNNQNNE